MTGLKELIESARESSNDFIGLVVASVRDHLGADVSFLAEFRGNRKVVRRFSGEQPGVCFEEGQSFPLKETYCYRVSQGELPNVIENAMEDARVKDLAITAELNIGAYLSVPVMLPDGRQYGTLCALHNHPSSHIHERDLRFMHVLGDILGDHVGRQQEVIRDYEIKIDRINEAINKSAFHTVFQPIVDIDTGEMVGAEALSRFDIEPQRTPDRWFAEAAQVGLQEELEMAAVHKALAHIEQLPEGIYLSVNVSPRILQSEALMEALEAVDASRVVVEVTEHEVVDEYEPLLAAVKRLDRAGARLAVDDAGAGYSGLSHIIRVSPRIMKLDMSLTRGIYRDVIKQALATSAVTFASRVGMDIVAEGVETAEDALALKIIGVRYGQGYYFAKPGALPIKLNTSPAG